MRYVLVVLLLALVGMLGTTVPERPVVGPAVAVAHQDAPAVDDLVQATADATVVDAAGIGVVAAGGAHAGHGTETIGLLCLCALLVSGIVLAVRRPRAYWISGRVMYRKGIRGARPQMRAWAVGHALRGHPLLWGVSRT